MNYPKRLLLSFLLPSLLAIICMATLPGDPVLRIGASILVATAFALMLARKSVDKNELEEKFRVIFTFSPDYMLVGRMSDGTIVEVNDGLETMTGYKASEVIGKTTIDLNAWDDLTHRSLLMDQLRQQQFVREMPTRLRRRDGIRRDVVISAAVIQLQGEPHYVAIIRDVTETFEAQRQLAASEARLKVIFETSPAPIAINRLSDFAFISVNPAWESLYGLSAHQVIGKSLIQCGFIAQDINALRTQTAILLSTNRLDDADMEFQTSSGRHISIIYSSRIVELGGELAMIVINTDVSRLREIETRLKAIVEAAPIPITITRLADHSYLQVNAEFERLAGQSTDYILGKNLKQLGFRPIHPEFLHHQTEQLLTNGQLDNEQLELFAPDGRCITLMYSSRIIELNGEPAIITIASDITQLKEVETGLRLAEAARLESETRFVALFQSSPVALGVFRSVDGHFVADNLNAAWYRVFGYPVEQIIGHTTDGIGLWNNVIDQKHIYAAIETSGEIRDYECWVQCADGRTILCSVSCSLIHSGNERLLLVAYLDISSKHQIEYEIRLLNADLEFRIQERTRELQQAQSGLMQAEKMASLGSLVAGITHELNTPIGTSLTVATTLTDMTRSLQEQIQNGIRRSTLEQFLDNAQSGTAIMARNLQRAAELIQSFKNIAVDQASDLRRSFDLRQLLQEILIALQPSLKNKPYTISLEVEEGLTLDSYPGPFEQVVINLINNAILHGFDGRDQGAIVIRGREGRDRAHVWLSICDDGIGISPEVKAHIFDPFFTTKIGKGGSGLGLHLVRNIVEINLGGNITAQCGSNAGTCMEMELPCRAPAARSAASDVA